MREDRRRGRSLEGGSAGKDLRGRILGGSAEEDPWGRILGRGSAGEDLRGRIRGGGSVVEGGLELMRVVTCSVPGSEHGH